MMESIEIGDYVLGEPLGRGGMGRVWRARHRARGTEAALKIATSRRAARIDFLEEFEREVQAAASLNHPHVVTVYDYGRLDEQMVRAFGGIVDPGAPWLAMSVAESGTMDDHKPATYRQLRHVLLQLLDALAHSHARGVIHRDLKPSNLLVSGHGEWGPEILLSDFGIAHLERPLDTPTPDQMNSSSAGTPLFMAPEQFRGDWRLFGPPTDLYAVGCMSYYWATGEAPFTGSNIVKLAMQHYNDPVPPIEGERFALPDGFDAWVATLLAKSPGDRFALAADAAWGLLAVGLPDDEQAPGEQQYADEPSPTPTLFEMTTLASDATYTDTLPSSASVASGESGAGGRCDSMAELLFETPPIPATWRPTQAKEHCDSDTVGTGLFGLREVPFVDRHPERNAIWDALKQVHHDASPRALIVRGPAGRGKSKLAAWMSARALETGAANTLTVLNSEGYGADEFAWALGRHLRVMGQTPDEARETLERVLPTLSDTMLSVLLRLLDPVMELPADQPREGVPRTMRIRCLQAVLASMTRRRPLILWLDDAQWAEEGLELVQRLLESGPPSPILTLITVRDEALAEADRARNRLDALADLARSSTVRIGALEHSDQLELVGGLLDLAPRLVEEVVERSEGNPLFAVQLVGDWVQRDCLEATAEGLNVTDEAELHRTGTMAEIWKRRLRSLYERLDEQAPEALCAAAALGVTIRSSEWRAVLEELDIEMPRRIVSRLALERLARRHEEGWAFVHGLLTDTLVEEARERGTWPAINAACARTLARQYDTPNTFQAHRVAEHFREAGLLEDAVEWFITAGREARTTEHFGEMFENLDAIQATLDALDVPESDARRGWYRFLDVAARFNERPLGETQALAGSLIEDAKRLDWSRVGAEARMASATALSGLGEFDEARRVCQQACDLYEAAGESVDYARALGKLGYITWHTHRPEEARRLCETSLEIQIAQKDRSGQARNRDRLAFMWRDSAPEKATAHYEAALTLAREQGMLEEQAHILDGLAHLARARGDGAAAREGFIEAANTFAAIESPAEYMSRLNLALLDIAEGAYEDALTRLGPAIDVFDAYGVLTYAMHARAARIHCLVALGESGVEEDLAALRSRYEQTPTHTPPVLRQLEAAIEHCDDEALAEQIGEFASVQREGLEDASGA